MIPRFDDMIAVGLGGFLGANARYILSGWVAIQVQKLVGREFPYGTLFVNVTGSFLLGVFGAWIVRQTTWSEHTRLFVATGFFGAYTTFSTYANESVILLRGQWQTGLLNILLSNVLCMISAAVGIWMAQRLYKL